MGVLRCPAGHFYDDEKFSECPHCKQNISAKPRRGFNDEMTRFEFSPGKNNPPVQKIRMEQSPSAPDEKTVGIFQMQGGQDPVVGWLVCVKGKEKGRDYRLHAGRNFIGRSLKNDIAIPDDAQISREDHCSLVFEPTQCTYVLVKGTGEGVLVDGKLLQNTQALQGEECIELGNSSFVLIAFCREGRTW